MKIRFIEFKNDIYVVLGMSYDYTNENPEYFQAVPLNEFHPTIIKTILQNRSIKIPFTEAIEITSKNRIQALMVLYG